MRLPLLAASVFVLFLSFACEPASGADRVTTDAGTIEGTSKDGLRSFKGIPYAAPPVGDLRWKAPQPVPPWPGVRPAERFGPRAMQRSIFGDMNFRSDGMSEDCLYLNVWTPAASDQEKLPVLVYFYGGGFIGGDGSEGRYDGESMARQGIVTVTVNYRLNVFGFFAHPELTAESPYHASGNYGFLDQHAALAWVRRNVAAFGGDPRRVTIGGESAGSISVSAQMASPLSRDLIAGAIGESGSLLGTLQPVSLAEAEGRGVQFAAKLGTGDAPTLATLRSLPAAELLEATAQPGLPRLAPVVDGYFLPKTAAEIYRAGEQAHVPLLAGVNSEEGGYRGVLESQAPTVENYRHALERLYPGHAGEVFRLYPADDETAVVDAAQDLASDRFISYGTWKWVDLATRTGQQPTYYYLYTHRRPGTRPDAGKEPLSPARGAVHASDIEYALGNLDQHAIYAWTSEDYQVSRQMQAALAQFIKTGDPNGPGLPAWPKFSTGQRLVIDVQPRPESLERIQKRYELLDTLVAKP